MAFGAKYYYDDVPNVLFQYLLCMYLGQIINGKVLFSKVRVGGVEAICLLS